MKPNRPDARGGHDRWLLSYADLVTLLLALFTTLYAASSVDANKLAPLQTSLREAFDAPPIVEVLNPRGALVPPVTVTPGQTAQNELQARLMQELSEALRLQRVDIHRDARGLIVSLPEEAAFATASTDLSPEARDLIGRVANAVRPTTNAMRIEGHTDNVPIRTARYSSNWELSTARASAVVAYLVESSGIDPVRLSAAGYGEFHPRVANDTPENRARNRRIDVVILGPPWPAEASNAGDGGATINSQVPTSKSQPSSNVASGFPPSPGYGGPAVAHGAEAGSRKTAGARPGEDR